MNPELITAPELAKWLADEDRVSPVLLDVRETPEVQHCHITNSIHMAMNTVPARMHELDPDDTIVCICHHGARSWKVAQFLQQNGFDKVINLTGGIHAWATLVDTSMPTY
ncbi:rhodanese-related sulfurtransferase [Oxalobacteraceae bacterium GrIS 2.11]